MDIDIDRNQRFYSSSLRFFAGRDEGVFPVEQRIIDSLELEWSDARMLDVGVGAGRTTSLFAPLVREYVGIDYSAELVEHCRSRFGESEDRRFEVVDARRLDESDLGAFDFVLFSFNGIDYVDHDARQQILLSIHSTLEGGGWFLFSSHSIHGVSKWWPSPAISRRQPMTSLLKLVKAMVKVPLLVFRNRGVDLRTARDRGWTIIEDGAYRLGVETYYVDPVEQVRQLEAAGFGGVTAYSIDGARIDPLTTNEQGWISYLVRKAGN